MKVDVGRLKDVLEEFKDSESSNYNFAVGAQVKRSNVLPLLTMEGMGTIPIPVSIKDMNRLKKASEASYINQDSNIKAVNSRGKRTCWQIDAINVGRQGITAENFFRQTVYSLSADGLRLLGFNDKEVSLVEPKLEHVLVCERGGTSPLHVTCNREPGFCTMFIQIPVKNGYSGGNLKVKHRDRTITFDHVAESNREFYTTIFYSDCEHEWTEVLHGWRLVLVFSLVWKWSRSPFMSLPHDEMALLLTAKEIEFILSPWRLPDENHQRLLAIPLDHKYTKDSLSFARLKGRDRLMASLLHSINSIDLHLACVRRSPVVNITSNVDVCVTDKEEFRTECWVNARTDSIFAFRGLDIDVDTELVFPMFSPKENRETTKDKSPVVSVYYDAMLVIWPKTSTIDLACKHGFTGALDLLEILVKALPREEVLFVLGRTISYCCSKPRRVWSARSSTVPGQVTHRLLQVCIDLEATEQGLILLSLLAEDFPSSPVTVSDDISYETNSKYEGIQTSQVAIALAKLIQMAGWSACSEAISRLLTPVKIAAQMEPLAVLATSLMKHGLIDVAIYIADRICPILFSPERSWDSPVYNATAEMIFSFEDWPESNNYERGTLYITMARKIPASYLCNVIVYIKKTLCDLIQRSLQPNKLYSELCQILVKNNLTAVRATSVNGESILIEVIKCLLWFNDYQILQDFVKRVTLPTKGNNTSLQALVSSNKVWDTCCASAKGKQILQLLVDCRLRELSLMQPPVFTWMQPDAVMPKYPEIEAFLRSKELTLTYSTKFPNVNEARLWAVEAFGYGFEMLSSPDSNFFMDHHYSATVHVKKIADGRAVCDITKNRRLHEHSIRQFELRQRELKELIERCRTELYVESQPTKRVKFNLP